MIIVITILAIAGIGAGFITFSPQFGSKDKQFSMERMLASEYFDGKKFRNIDVTKMGSVSFKTLYEFFFTGNSRRPQQELPLKERSAEEFTNSIDQTRLTWFGHSTVFLEIDGKKIFIDPMFGNVPAPHPLLGASRYNSKLPLEIDDIPELDAVIISHDHYDHLDYGSIIKLKDRVKRFYTPLGVGSHLVSWGVDESKIFELDWWEEAGFDGILIAATPARHFSGRGLTDGNQTQWASWVIKGAQDNIFFSGDSGYTKSFQDIGDKYGPFDISMVECGQYHEEWSDIHMMPEETAQVGVDLRSKLLMPIHWGAFTLALHQWDDPIKRVIKAAEDMPLQVTTPIIGQSITLGEEAPSTRWWERY